MESKMSKSWVSNAVWTAPLAVAVALLMLAGTIAAAPVGNTATPAGGALSAQWAYDVQKNVTFNVTNNGTTYDVSGSLAYAVVFTQTNTSATTFQLEVQRTIGFALTATFSTTGVVATLSSQGVENITGFANFTTTGTVYVGGVAVPAIAVVDQSHTSTASLKQSSSITLGRHTASGTLTATLDSQGSTTFTPALGIVPVNVSVGETWNASTTIAHIGAIQGTFAWTRTHFNGAVVTGNGSLSVNPTITAPETITGTDLGNVTLMNGLSGQAINLTTTGPIQPRDGVLWTPAGADLFHNNKLWNPASGLLGIGTDRLDWVPHFRAHFGLVGSQTGFSPSPDGSSVAGQPMTSTVTATGTSPSAAPSSAEQLQAQPATVAQAQALSNCLTAGQGNCASGSSSSSSPLTTEVVVVVVGVAAVALLGAVLVARRSSK
jgi:hypothetical protein